MIVEPDQKLITKQWFVLMMLSVIIGIVGWVLQFLITLKESLSEEQVTSILWPITIGIIFLIWIISVPIVILWVKNLTYQIEDDRISILKGIITKQQQNIPYRAITDFMLHRSLFDRFLGIGSIRIQTAGQTMNPSGYEGKLSGLIHWDELYQHLRSKIAALHPTSEAIATKEPSDNSIENKIQNEILEEIKAIRKLMNKP